MANDFVISPKELRDAEIREQFRGYDKDDVDQLFERAAQTLEHLAARARGRASDPPAARVTARELVDGDLREVLRGYHKDTVNDLADRAAATIELLETRISNLGDDPVTAEVAAITSEIEVVPPDAELLDNSAAVESVAPPLAVTEVPSGVPAVVLAGLESAEACVKVELADRPYDVHVGPGALARLAEIVAGRRMVAVISQPNIVQQHGARLAAELESAGVESEWFTMDDGEPAKSLDTVARLASELAGAGMLRADAIVAFGGGVVGDTAGFVAATYHRGIDFVQVPTTLLAMVDSAIGGKTGVNLPEGKNLVGAFHQPLAVLSDPALLFTLSPREYHCGLGEVAKYALMGDSELAELLDRSRGPILVRDPAVLAAVIQRSVAVKADYVARDEFERSGLRAHLNYGHTLAHAIETVAEHALAHGEAVAVGLVFAGALAGALERIDAASVERHRSVIDGLGLPTRAPVELSRAALIEVMRRDKKAAGGLTFVLQGPNGLERVDDPEPSALNAAFAAVGIS